jgi:hypothetical protein
VDYVVAGSGAGHRQPGAETAVVVGLDVYRAEAGSESSGWGGCCSPEGAPAQDVDYRRPAGGCLQALEGVRLGGIEQRWPGARSSDAFKLTRAEAVVLKTRFRVAGGL